ncbi:MAG: LysE family transporter [bacterium]|nr:LysE family transporter [bacterium]
MEYLALIGTVTMVHLLAVISPGPDFIIAVKNSLSYSRKTGIWTSVGFAMGISVHIFYCVAGLAVLISQSILLFNIIKLIGAGYLIYLGVKAVLSKSTKIEIESLKQKNDISALEAVKIGFLTNVLNPKATLFFLSLFTLVISPNVPKVVLVVLSIIMIVNTAIWFSLVALFFTQKKVVSVFSKFQGIFNKIFGSLLIALGIKIALSQK